MSGTIGQELLPELAVAGHTVTRLKSGAAHGPQEIAWDPLEPTDPVAINGFDAVIHLAGENIFGRWNAAKKKRIRASRVEGTRNLCAALAACAEKPKALLCASAIGYYGSRADEVLTEGSAAGTGFLAETCDGWEAATEPARAAGTRVVNLRFGIVLSTKSGALKQMLTPFRLGLGGKIGSGKQWMSWIAVADAVGAILFCLESQGTRGPMNVAAPNPVSNGAFTRTLGEVLHRPTIATVPGFVARTILGREMAEETVLASQRVFPQKLMAAGFKFQYPELKMALAALLD
jgi:uncharacterized protein (TIGR01777 family)